MEIQISSGKFSSISKWCPNYILQKGLACAYSVSSEEGLEKNSTGENWTGSVKDENENAERNHPCYIHKMVNICINGTSSV